ncbi:M4 family metallopeptidase [Hymenobacter cavernae]|uniref:T9SS C-terminal target domain-containing protein n=1 Tax=Hymenobacter cavernae TaxID=2044852 RepID=A0ABQ1TQE4_9BACT|nr:M4 family metallopeptidase [Hymenobacter cavernae]GGF00961.1 hypothetical protein GCM10011383_09710 [Hymenobacter cavernae]
MSHKYSAVLLLLGGLAHFSTHAQDLSRVQQKVVAEDGSPAFVHFKPGSKAYGQSEATKALTDQLQLTKDDQVLQTKAEADQLGFVHQKFEQYYRGIKVEHSAYTVHARRGAIESISGHFAKVRGLNVTPSLSAQAALQRALDYVGARQYMWQSAAAEADLKQEQNDLGATYKPKAELVIVTPQAEALGVEAGMVKPVLAWKFNIYAQQPLSRAYIYVDAQSGQVVLKDDIIKHAAATGTYATAYSGTRSIADETTTGGYRLREYTRGLGIETYNCKKGSSYTAATDFIDADNSWTEYNNANYDNVAGDAHFGAQATYDYWKAVHGRNSFDNAGAKIKSYVHFDDVPGGAGYENAFWDGARMTYGDGASTFKPLTALDVCGHEIGHAVCENTANLTYSYESGAMNEGFSDIWGAAVEARAVGTYGLTGKSTWLIGEQIMKAGGALRSMSNPNAYGQPDTYKGTYWATGSADNGGVHTNSGVLNYWFYLLSQGGSGTNDIGSSYSVTGIGIDAAAKIAFRAEDVYLTASSNYANARTAAIQAATDLYGAGSAQVIATTNAWYAVGVGAVYNGGGTTTPPPTTGTTYCTSKGSTSYEWIDLVNLGSINRASGADGGYYDGTATTTSVAAGSSQTISFSAAFATSAYTEYWRIYIDWNQDGDFTDSGETIVSGSSASAGTLSASFTVPTTAKTGKTRLRVVMSYQSGATSCGTYSYGETEDYAINVSGGTFANTGVAGISAGGESLSQLPGRQFEVYPNPATDVLRLALPDNAEVKSVKLFDVRGAAVKGATYDGNGQLNVAGLASGLYTLTVSDGQKEFHQRFVKQ